MTLTQLAFSSSKAQIDPQVLAVSLFEEAQTLANDARNQTQAIRKYFSFLNTYREWLFPTSAVDLNMDQPLTTENLATFDLITTAPEAEEESLNYESLAALPLTVQPFKLILTYEGKGKPILQNCTEIDV